MYIPLDKLVDFDGEVLRFKRTPYVGEPFLEIYLTLPEVIYLLPIGTILPWPSEEVPSNWMYCHGEELNRESYADLFFFLGTTWGDGDGETTFNVPDLRQRVIAGAEATGVGDWHLGDMVGELATYFTYDHYPLSNINVKRRVRNLAAGSEAVNEVMDWSHESDYLATSGLPPEPYTGSGQEPIPVVQPTAVMYWIIKYI